jgi:hypothetical protein
MSAIFLMNPVISTIKESVTPTLITEWVKIVGALVAFVIGIQQYLRAQQWKRREFLAAQIKDFESDRKVQAALTMLDWSGRRIAFFPDIATTAFVITVNDPLLCSALVPHEAVDGYLTHEALIRDCFDRLFDGLVRFSNFVEADLISMDELRPYLRYWMCSISGTKQDYHCSDFYTLLHNYIIYYDFTEARSLIESFGYVVKPPKGKVDVAIATVKDSRPQMSDRGDPVA